MKETKEIRMEKGKPYPLGWTENADGSVNLARLQKTHGKVYQAALIGSVQFTKSILSSIYQAENKCLFIN